MKNKSDYTLKLIKNISPVLENITKPKILELGVRHGLSTNFFLKFCEKKGGKLFSVDIDDCSKAANSKNWKFIQCRDDNFNKITKEAGTNFDLIYIDSFHNAKHVSKLIYLYYKNLKKNGCIFIDDISWILYSKKNTRDNFNSEINNYETFLEILDILNTNMTNIYVNFDFSSSGLCKIEKISNNKLNSSLNIKIRNLTIKNLIRKIFLK
jgi:predicted O-methyltransferase YrrM